MPGTVQGTCHVVEVTAAEAGGRLDRVLAARLAGISRSRLKALIEAGHVGTTGPAAGPAAARAATVTEPSYRVKPGQSFAIFVPDAVAGEPEAEPIALDIRYEDDHLLVLDKPAGLVVHPAPGNPSGTLVNALLHHCGAGLTGIGGVRRPGIVHRLDKDTSGLMVVAKTEAAHAGLSLQFRARRIERAYRALAWGRPMPPAGEIAGGIGRDPANRKRMAAVPTGKPALTRYRTLRTFGGGLAALLECRLATGRTHQIRVHLASRGHPVVGDRTYGGGLTAARRRGLPPPLAAAIAGFGRQALHATALGFRHPASSETLRFESHMPSDLNGLIGLLDDL
jgi:23S rRNA pseudouridine1911/1915/1917 synthase